MFRFLFICFTSLVAIFSNVAVVSAADDSSVKQGNAERGQDIFHSRGKPKYPGQVIGNCTACHSVRSQDLVKGDTPGNVGPALMAMKARLTDKQMFDKIWDANVLVPNSLMPPFGKSGMMTKQDIADVVAYLKTL